MENFNSFTLGKENSPVQGKTPTKKGVRVQDIIDLINEGCTKNAKSPHYNPSVGTIHGRLNTPQRTVKSFFEQKSELRRAYQLKFAGGKEDIELID